MYDLSIIVPCFEEEENIQETILHLKSILTEKKFSTEVIIVDDNSHDNTYIIAEKTINDNTTQHNTTQHNTTQHNTTQHNTTQHNTTQHNTTQHNTTLYALNWLKN